MRKLLGAAAAVALLGAPAAASAQGHGGHGFAAHGGFGWGHGGYGGWGYRGGWGHGWGGWYPYWGVGLGLALSPWYYGYPGYWDYYGAYPYYDYYSPPPRTAATACGNWVWRSDANQYEWVPQPCGAPPPGPGPQTPPQQ